MNQIQYFKDNSKNKTNISKFQGIVKLLNKIEAFQKKKNYFDDYLKKFFFEISMRQKEVNRQVEIIVQHHLHYSQNLLVILT